MTRTLAWGQKEGFSMPKSMVPRRGPVPRPLMADEDARRLQGLRTLARIIVRHHITCQEQVIASDDERARGAVGGDSSATASPSQEGGAA